MRTCCRKCFRTGSGVGALVAVGLLAEELKVAAVVEDPKAPLARIFAVDGIPRRQRGRAEPRTPADHLPEFRFAAHLFEKDKVDALRHIDARVHHIHRDRNEWRLVRLFEIVNDGLRISIVTDDPLDEPGYCCSSCGYSLQNRSRINPAWRLFWAKMMVCRCGHRPPSGCPVPSGLWHRVHGVGD